MKKYLIVTALLLVSVPALADNVTIVRDPDATTVRNLPGNAQIVTGNGDTVVVEGHDSIARQMLLGPRVRVYQGGGASTLSTTCSPTLSKGDYRRCMRDFQKAQEEIRKKYND